MTEEEKKGYFPFPEEVPAYNLLLIGRMIGVKWKNFKEKRRQRGENK